MKYAISTLALVAVGLMGSTAAAEPAADTTAQDRSTLDGIGLGVELGEPSSITVGYLAADPGIGASVAIGTGTMSGTGLQLRADVTWIPVVFNRQSAVRIPLRVGLGGRYYRHGYAPASLDEIDDRHTGVRLPIGAAVALMDLGLEIYLEVAPGYDLARTESCNLGSGASSVCPHTMSSRAFVHGVVGLRYYLWP
jgi:hypothetical protein